MLKIKAEYHISTGDKLAKFAWDSKQDGASSSAMCIPLHIGTKEKLENGESTYLPTNSFNPLSPSLFPVESEEKEREANYTDAPPELTLKQPIDNSILFPSTTCSRK